MRHTTLLVSSLLASAATAQNYLANDPVWLVASICGVPAPCIATDNYNYYTAGDSLIQGVTWTKVQREGQYTLAWQSPNQPDPNCQGLHPYGPAYYGVKLIRQEVRELRIWADDADQLLHDFDLVVGSTLPVSYTNWNTDITVLAVDSVLIGTEMRARYELANSWAQYLIEGVGTSHGLFEPVSNFFDCGYSLDCFGLGADAFYPDAGGSSCWVVMAVDESDGLTGLTLAPNPADNMVTISTTASTAQEVLVRDMSGRIVLQERIASAPTSSLDVSGLPNGFYALSVSGLLPARLVVAH
ncbi:MAG: T9SS type A sorting domain-containing protein [Flavobacteriales bacterium]|nr:T9SS type A sorting domain-containing protein [Flavobacteriales bacterium]